MSGYTINAGVSTSSLAFTRYFSFHGNAVSTGFATLMHPIILL
jgi:hypothetical protein